MNIKDLKEQSLLNQTFKKITLGDYEITVINKKSMKDKMNIIDTIINMCIEKEKFFNPFKVELVTKLIIIKEYTDIEIDDEEFLNMNIYQFYDILDWNNAFNVILPLIDDYQFILDWCILSCEKLNQFWTSFTGTLIGLNEIEQEEKVLGQLKEALDQFKNDQEIQSALTLIKKQQ